MSVDAVVGNASSLDDETSFGNPKTEELEVEKAAGKNVKLSGWKKLLQKKVMEKLVCANKKKNIETESKNVQMSLNKEERMLRGQLERLQEEQRCLMDDEDDSSVMIDVTSEFEGEEDSENLLFDMDDDDDVINPYPVTIQRQRPPSARIILHDKKRSIHDLFCRKSSSKNTFIEYEDLDSQSLPRLSKCDTSTVHQGAAGTKEEDCWIGEPEAINSIRRPLRPNSQRTRTMSRSRSLKEKGGSSHDSLAVSFGNMELGNSGKQHSPRSSIQGIHRQQSLKERKLSDETRPDTSKLNRSRHLSLKERKKSYEDRCRNWVQTNHNSTPPNTPIAGSPPQQSILRRRKILPMHLRPLPSRSGTEAVSAASTPEGPLSPVSVSDHTEGQNVFQHTRKNSKKSKDSSDNVVHRRWCSQ